MADKELFNWSVPRFGTAAGVALDGAASLTASIDVIGFDSVLLLLTTTTAIAYDDMTLSFEHSDDDVVFAPVDALDIIYRAPTDGASTSQVFHASYVGKKRYVKAKAQTTLGTELGQLTVLLAHSKTVPPYAEEIEV